MTGNTQINYTGVSKSFAGTDLFSDVNISLHGSLVGILTGENGSGKTTLLRILAGLEKPDSGYVNFGSVDTSWKKARKRLLENVMYLHQNPYMFEGSVYRNLALALPRSMAELQIEEQVNRALNWGILTRHAAADAKTLSGGQQQRVALARAWLRRSPVLLLDEPITSMDTQSSARTIKLLHQLKRANIAILICSHNHRAFDSLVDYQVELSGQKLVNAETIKYGDNITHINREKTQDNALG